MTTMREQAGERPFRVMTLDNGLRVVVSPQADLHRAHVALYVRVGSRFEVAETNGISHFLEHMLYRGTPRLKNAHEVNLAFESLGGYLYAATQADFGVFSVTLPHESLKEATELFSDVLLSPTFADIEIEKGIVSEEILEDLDDEGRQVDADNLSRLLIYPTHPLGFTITGDEERVRSFDLPKLRAHHARHYTAETSVLAFSGPIEPERAFDLANTYFASMPRGNAIPAEAPVHHQKKPRVQIVGNVSSQTELRVSFRAISERDDRRPVMDMLLRILDDGMSTRLYHRICDDQGLCYDVGATFDGYEDDGILDFTAGCQHSRVSVVTREILKILEELVKQGPSEDELAKARRRNAWEVQTMFDSPDELAGFYAGGLLFDRIESPEARLAANSKVTSEDLRAFVADICQPDRLNALAVGLLEKDEDKRFVDLIKNFRGI